MDPEDIINQLSTISEPEVQEVPLRRELEPEPAHPTHEEIAKRAYEIWKHEFGDIDTTHEVEVQLWLRAEAQLEHHWGRHHPEEAE